MGQTGILQVSYTILVAYSVLVTPNRTLLCTSPPFAWDARTRAAQTLSPPPPPWLISHMATTATGSEELDKLAQLSIVEPSAPPLPAAQPSTTHDPRSTTSSRPSSSSSSTSDEDSENDEQPHTHQRTPTLPPQLGALELPSSTFGLSFIDLLAPSPPAPVPHLGLQNSLSTGEGPRPRQRTVSTLGALRSSVYLATPQLQFSAPRKVRDDRIRKPGQEEEEEEVWVGDFPQEGEELDLGTEWGVKEWETVDRFLQARGYRLDVVEEVSPASRGCASQPGVILTA